mmetsp:Transcript_14618/g.33116  ORF Transcript_14618/g.33116 Transcript_14618/m.33116 type:complete len:219 (-) Transcript_14618:5-661(-)
MSNNAESQGRGKHAAAWSLAEGIPRVFRRSWHEAQSEPHEVELRSCIPASSTCASSSPIVGGAAGNAQANAAATALTTAMIAKGGSSANGESTCPFFVEMARTNPKTSEPTIAAPFVKEATAPWMSPCSLGETATLFKAETSGMVKTIGHTSRGVSTPSCHCSWQAAVAKGTKADAVKQKRSVRTCPKRFTKGPRRHPKATNADVAAVQMRTSLLVRV